jgi:hypothetical protein
VAQRRETGCVWLRGSAWLTSTAGQTSVTRCFDDLLPTSGAPNAIQWADPSLALMARAGVSCRRQDIAPAERAFMAATHPSDAMVNNLNGTAYQSVLDGAEEYRDGVRMMGHSPISPPAARART